MDDEGGDWFADTADEPTPTAAAAPKTIESATEEHAPAEADVVQVAEAQEIEYFDPDKLLLFKHWIRPRFLQYDYLYKYRHNYYDDVIDYLDKRQRGLTRDVPRAQTWAERALRTYTNKNSRREYFKKSADDIKLITNTKLSGSFFNYHSKQYVNRRYSSILFDFKKMLDWLLVTFIVFPRTFPHNQ